MRDAGGPMPILFPIIHSVIPDCLCVLEVFHLCIAVFRQRIEIGKVVVRELSAMR